MFSMAAYAFYCLPLSEPRCLGRAQRNRHAELQKNHSQVVLVLIDFQPMKGKDSGKLEKEREGGGTEGKGTVSCKQITVLHPVCGISLILFILECKYCFVLVSFPPRGIPLTAYGPSLCDRCVHREQSTQI
jgi:hypothetical protein